MKNKIVISCLFCVMIVLLSLGLSACKSNEKKQNKNIIPVTPSENSFVSEQLNVPESSKNVFSVRYSGENIFFNGYHPQTTPYNSTINMVDLKTNQTTNISFESDVSGTIHHLVTENYIYIEHDTDNQSVFTIEKLDKKTGKCITNKEADYFNKVSDMFFDEKGNICLLTYRYTELGNVTQLNIYSQELELIDIIDLNEKLKMNGQSPLSIIESDDSYYILSQSTNGIIQIYNLKKDLSVGYSTEVSDAADIFCDAVISSDGDLLVFSYDENNQKLFVDIIDSKNGNLKEMIELNDIPFYNICGSYEKYDFIYLDDDGVYGYLINNEASEKITGFDAVDITNFKSYCLNKNELSFINFEYDNPLNTIYQTDLKGNIIDKYIIDFSDEGEMLFDYCITGSGKLGYISRNNQTRQIKYYCMDEIGKTGVALPENCDLYEVMTADQSGNVCIAVTDSQKNSHHLLVFDQQLNIAKDIEIDAETINGMCYGKDGNIIISEVTSGKNIISIISSDTGEEIKEIQADNYFGIKDGCQIINGSDEYDFFYFDKTSVYGYISSTGKFKEIINTDSFEYSISNVYLRDSNTIVCLGQDMTSPEDAEFVHIYLLKKSDKPIPKKIEIRVAVLGRSDDSVKQMIKKYNKTNTNYYLDVVEYDFSEMSNFNNDIINGKQPDIMITSRYYDMTKWIRDDMTEDLKEYFSNDKDITLDKYSENIVSASESDGKINFIFPSYKINVLIGKSSDVSDETKWNVDEFISCMESDPKPDFYNVSAEKVLEKTVLSNLYGYIDFKKNECCFDNSSFIKYLDYLKKISANTEEKSDYPFREDKTTLDFIDIGGFEDFNLMEKGTIGEDSSLKGMPGIYGSSVTIDPSYMMCIFKKSEYKQESWSFIKSFLTDEYQNSLIEDQKMFPVKNSVLDAFQQKQAASNSVKYYTYGDEEIKIYGIDNETTEKITNIVKSANRIKTDDEEINKIINEETYDFFNGSKTSVEVSKNLQNRISVYLSEIN